MRQINFVNNLKIKKHNDRLWTAILQDHSNYKMLILLRKVTCYYIIQILKSFYTAKQKFPALISSFLLMFKVMIYISNDKGNIDSMRSENENFVVQNSLEKVFYR